MNAKQVKKIKQQIGKKYNWYIVSRRCDKDNQRILAKDEIHAVEKFIHRFLYKYKMYPSDYIPNFPISMKRQITSDYKVITPKGFTLYLGQ